MSKINFDNPGGFPLEQETLDRLQKANREEFYSMLKQHMGIKENENYVISVPTSTTKGWLVIHGELYKLMFNTTVTSPTNFVKTTRSITALRYGDGIYRSAYEDFTSEYITEIPANPVTHEPIEPNSKYFAYYDVSTFKKVGFLPLDGSKAMEGDLDLGGNQLSNLDTNLSETANVRAKEFKLGHLSKRGSLFPNDYLGRALVDDTDSLQINYQSDWENTVINGDVKLSQFVENSTSSVKSPLVVDVNGKLSKGSPYQSIPLGLIALWHDVNGNPPAGWEKCNLTRLSGGLTIPNLTADTINDDTTTESVYYIIYVGLDVPSINAGQNIVKTLNNSETFYNATFSPIEFNGVLENLSLVGWTQKSGPAATITIDSLNNKKITITGNLSIGEYVFELKGTDTLDAEYIDEVSIIIKSANLPPVFNSVFNGNENVDITNDSSITIATVPTLFLEDTPGYTVGISDPDGNIFSNNASLQVTIIRNQTQTLVPLAQLTNHIASGIRKFNFELHSYDINSNDILRLVATDENGAVTVKEYTIIKEPSISLLLSAAPTVGTSTITKTFEVQVNGLPNETLTLNAKKIFGSLGNSSITVKKYNGISSSLTLSNTNNVSSSFNITLDNTGIKKFQVIHMMPKPAATSTNQNTQYQLNSELALASYPNKKLSLYLNYYVSGGASGGGGCFDVETLVTMASGQAKKLKNVLVGDTLQGLDFPDLTDESKGDYFQWEGKLNEARKTEVTVVNKTTRTAPNYFEIITQDGGNMKVTGEHPLLITQDGINVLWVRVKNIVPTMSLVDKYGKAKAIQSIIFKDETLEIATLDVEMVDNYVIAGIVAHNKALYEEITAP